MATSIFNKKENKPTDEELNKVLKTSLDTWNYLFDYLEHSYGILTKEWKFYGNAAGWTLRISNEKGKNIVFLAPNDNHFLLNINMSVKVKEEVLQADISEENKRKLENAKVYQEGTSILINIENENDLNDIKTILSIKDK